MISDLKQSFWSWFAAFDLLPPVYYSLDIPDLDNSLYDVHIILSFVGF